MENLTDMEKRFPIIDGPSIPWNMIAPHETQAFTNHRQSLERLATRGGLSMSEAVAVLEDCKWNERSQVDARFRLTQLVDHFEGGLLNQKIAGLESVIDMAILRLGGEVDGVPTHRHNFLQRIDQLVEKETTFKNYRNL
jgi:hypothetical protein